MWLEKLIKLLCAVSSRPPRNTQLLSVCVYTHSIHTVISCGQNSASLWCLTCDYETEEDSTAISANQISTTNSLDVPPIVQSEEGSEHREIKDQINKASYWNLFHVISMLGPSIFALSPQLLIPRHNSIYYPNFRHEFIIITSAGCFVTLLRTDGEKHRMMKNRNIIVFIYYDFVRL